MSTTNLENFRNLFCVQNDPNVDQYSGPNRQTLTSKDYALITNLIAIVINFVGDLMNYLGMGPIDNTSTTVFRHPLLLNPNPHNTLNNLCGLDIYGAKINCESLPYSYRPLGQKAIIPTMYHVLQEYNFLHRHLGFYFEFNDIPYPQPGDKSLTDLNTGPLSDWYSDASTKMTDTCRILNSEYDKFTFTSRVKVLLTKILLLRDFDSHQCVSSNNSNHAINHAFMNGLLVSLFNLAENLPFIQGATSSRPLNYNP